MLLSRSAEFEPRFLTRLFFRYALPHSLLRIVTKQRMQQRNWKLFSKTASRPNIVLWLFDDAGYSDMSAIGGQIQTPNIERIVREGMTVKRFYTTAGCSPTRAGILSGRYPHVSEWRIWLVPRIRPCSAPIKGACLWTCLW
jgi:Sulfatase